MNKKITIEDLNNIRKLFFSLNTGFDGPTFFDYILMESENLKIYTKKFISDIYLEVKKASKDGREFSNKNVKMMVDFYDDYTEVLFTLRVRAIESFGRLLSSEKINVEKISPKEIDEILLKFSNDEKKQTELIKRLLLYYKWTFNFSLDLLKEAEFLKIIIPQKIANDKRDDIIKILNKILLKNDEILVENEKGYTIERKIGD